MSICKHIYPVIILHLHTMSALFSYIISSYYTHIILHILQQFRSDCVWTQNFYSACRRRGGVLKCPVSVFWFFFGVESWAAAHGLYRCTEYRLLSEPMSTRLLNSISSRICRQNTQFNMYTTTSKQEEGCTFKDSHPKCFITRNFDKFHREAFARGGESR